MPPPAAVPLPPIDVYVILDRAAAGGRDLVDLAGVLLEAGVRWLQLRDKQAGAGELLTLARRLQRRVEAAAGVLVVNDRPDVAVLAGARAVHLGQDDLPIPEVRRLWPALLVGVSTHDAIQARQAEADGADYVAVGSVFPTASKAGFELVGLDTVRRVRAEVRAPLLAIGGITLSRVPAVVAAGADGVAVISAVTGDADPGAAAARLLEAVRVARRGARLDRMQGGAR
jgi:thiamine-phosphate pyrophosphorylase